MILGGSIAIDGVLAGKLVTYTFERCNDLALIRLTYKPTTGENKFIEVHDPRVTSHCTIRSHGVGVTIEFLASLPRT